MSNNKFFEFGDNSSYTRGFPWAFRVHPRSEMFYQECQKCGSIIQYPIGEFDVDLEKGTRYPDILGCGAYPFLIIVSERVISVWQESGITCFQKYRIGIAKIQSKKLQHVPAPNYYRVESQGRVKIHLAGSGLSIVKYCTECHRLVTKPSVAKGFKVVENSWDGSDLFRDVDLYPGVNFCTRKILELAHYHKLTNFRFEPIEKRNSSSKGIDYLRKLPFPRQGQPTDMTGERFRLQPD